MRLVGATMRWLDPTAYAFIGWFEPAAELLVPGSAIGAAVWLFYRLFLRSDRRERDAFLAIKEQRDEWRLRAENAEESLVECHQELAHAELELHLLRDD